MLESGTCGRVRAPLLAQSHGSHRHRGTRAQAAAAAGALPVLKHQGLRLGLTARQVWPGTEEVPAALVGALGELRQFSVGWFKKGQNQQNQMSQRPDRQVEESGAVLALL